MTNLSSLSKLRLGLLLFSTTLLAALGMLIEDISKLLVLSTLAFSLASAGYCLWQASRLKYYVDHITEVCGLVAAGDTNQRTNESLDQGDILRLMTAVNHMVDTYDTFMREAVASASALSNNKYYRRIQLAGLRGGFRGYAQHINDSITRVQMRIDDFAEKTTAFEEATSVIAVALNNAGDQMNSTAHDMTDSATNTNERAAVVASASQETSVNVQMVSAAVEQLSASSREIGTQIERSAMVANHAVNETRQGEDKIHGLTESAETIGRVVELISAIAEQTNLLALNATIEAARAGDAGKGFAVVAGEVKELAGQTAKAIDDITQQVQTIQSATNGAVTAFANVSKVISEMEQITSAVAAAAEEQNAATAEIARNVEEAHSGTEQVASNITTVSKNAEETGQAADFVMESADRMIKDASTLQQEVSTFILGLRQGPLDRRETNNQTYGSPEMQQAS